MPNPDVEHDRRRDGGAVAPAQGGGDGQARDLPDRTAREAVQGGGDRRPRQRGGRDHTRTPCLTYAGAVLGGDPGACIGRLALVEQEGSLLACCLRWRQPLQGGRIRAGAVVHDDPARSAQLNAQRRAQQFVHRAQRKRQRLAGLVGHRLDGQPVGVQRQRVAIGSSLHVQRSRTGQRVRSKIGRQVQVNVGDTGDGRLRIGVDVARILGQQHRRHFRRGLRSWRGLRD